MNSYWIIGGIIIIIIVYFVVYKVVYKPKIINLNNSSKDTIISENQIDEPNSPNYTYSMWVYAKKINNSADTNIFYYGSSIRLDITKDSQLKFKDISVTEYFPLEQWVFVVICANGDFYDFYLDGKLVKTLENNTILIPDEKTIIIGYQNTSNVDIRLANFKRIAKVTTHYEVEVDYEKNKYIKDYYKSPKYNLEISLKNGEKDEKSYSLYTREKYI
jgi:hypothetical protein